MAPQSGKKGRQRQSAKALMEEIATTLVSWHLQTRTCWCTTAVELRRRKAEKSKSTTSRLAVVTGWMCAFGCSRLVRESVARANEAFERRKQKYREHELRLTRSINRRQMPIEEFFKVRIMAGTTQHVQEVKSWRSFMGSDSGFEHGFKESH